MNWNEITTIIFSGIGVIITGLCTWISSRLISWLNSKIKDKQLAKWSTALATIILDSVKNVFQTYVESLKQEGAFTKEKQEEALTKCLDIIKNQLTPELKEYVQTNFGDMETYLKNQIEAVIYSLKNNTKSTIA